ncbi:MAG TPA: hypothetical protein VE988_12740 [Gemmataceae bacterium]|nr:hypothetical protein [Gemmataceae bacterium]
MLVFGAFVATHSAVQNEERFPLLIDKYLNLMETREAIVIDDADVFVLGLQKYAAEKGIKGGKLPHEQFKNYFATVLKVDKNVLADPNKVKAMGLDIKDIASKRFKQLDKNGDGKLDTKEMPPGLNKLHPRFDFNGDDMLDEEEYRLFVHYMLPSLADEGEAKGVFRPNQKAKNGAKKAN